MCLKKTYFPRKYLYLWRKWWISLEKNKKSKKWSRFSFKTERGVLQKWSAAYCDFDHENLGLAVIFFSNTIFSHTLDEESQKVSFLIKHGHPPNSPTFLFWFIYTISKIGGFSTVSWIQHSIAKITKNMKIYQIPTFLTFTNRIWYTKMHFWFTKLWKSSDHVTVKT